MISQEQIYEAFEEYAESLFDIIKEQVPQPPITRNPYADGSLKNSLRMYQRKDGVISFAYFRYGIYTDLGTGPNTFEGTTDAFGLPLFAGYQKGTGGINPQFWTSLNSPYAKDAIKEFEEKLAGEIEFNLAGIIETTTQRQ